MARSSDSFFIRANLIANNSTFEQTVLDLGAYVDALGKSVLKIHNIQVHMQDATTLKRPPLFSSGTGGDVSWQLTTQSQTDIVVPSNRSVVSAGLTQFAEVGSGSGNGQLSSEAAGINVQHFTDGYLIAVEQLFLGAETTGLLNNTSISIVMECSVQTLTQSAAMALSLSQQ